MTAPRKAQSDLILAIVGISTILIVLAIIIPLIFTYRGASVPQNIKTTFTVLENYESHQLNASGYLAPNGALYIDLGRESPINASDISSIIGTLEINGHAVTAKLSKYIVKTVNRLLIINASKAARTACRTLNITCKWSILSAYIVLKNGITIPIRILSYKTIEKFKIVRGYVSGASARMITLIPFSYTKVNPANLSTLITSGAVDIGELILNTTPPRIKILPQYKAIEFLKNPTPKNPGIGMVSLEYGPSYSVTIPAGYVLIYPNGSVNANNYNISFLGPIGCLYILYGSSRRSYNIMITWNGASAPVNLVDINNKDLNLSALCPKGYRLVLIDFHGSIQFGLLFALTVNGFVYTKFIPVNISIKPRFNVAYYLYEYVDNDYYGYINGTARYVLLYCRSYPQRTYQSSYSNYNYINHSSYAPYILLGSLVYGNEYGLLFTTEDVSYRGNLEYDNDELGGILDEDYSAEPLVLVFRDLNITNTKYIAVAISVVYRFEDNEGLDYLGVTVDKPILFIGLVDVNDSKIVSYTTLTFRELTRYEDTYPPLAEGQSVTVFVPLPSPKYVGRHVYEVFIAIQDPYSRYYDESTGYIYNSLDFLLYIDSVGVVLFR